MSADGSLVERSPKGPSGVTKVTDEERTTRLTRLAFSWKPPKPPAPGTVPDPISDFIKAGRWKPAETAQAKMVDQFKKENGLK